MKETNILISKINLDSPEDKNNIEFDPHYPDYPIDLSALKTKIQKSPKSKEALIEAVQETSQKSQLGINHFPKWCEKLIDFICDYNFNSGKKYDNFYVEITGNKNRPEVKFIEKIADLFGGKVYEIMTEYVPHALGDFDRIVFTNIPNFVGGKEISFLAIKNVLSERSCIEDFSNSSFYEVGFSNETMRSIYETGMSQVSGAILALNLTNITNKSKKFTLVTPRKDNYVIFYAGVDKIAKNYDVNIDFVVSYDLDDANSFVDLYSDTMLSFIEGLVSLETFRERYKYAY